MNTDHRPVGSNYRLGGGGHGTLLEGTDGGAQV